MTEKAKQWPGIHLHIHPLNCAILGDALDSSQPEKHKSRLEAANFANSRQGDAGKGAH